MNHISKIKWIASALLCALSMVASAQPQLAQRMNHPRAYAEAISQSTLQALMYANAATILFVDIRSDVSKTHDSNPINGFIHIRYQSEDKPQLNTQFPLEVGSALSGKGLSIGAMIVLICGDGASSAEAAQWLAWAGHTNVVSVQGGAKEMAFAKQLEPARSRQPTEIPAAQKSVYFEEIS
jgi:rhodanese-related sulfurtransferase